MIYALHFIKYAKSEGKKFLNGLVYLFVDQRFAS